MDNTIPTMQKLLEEASVLLASPKKSDITATVAKLERIVALASTLSFTLQAARR